MPFWLGMVILTKSQGLGIKGRPGKSIKLFPGFYRTVLRSVQALHNPQYEVICSVKAVLSGLERPASSVGGTGYAELAVVTGQRSRIAEGAQVDSLGIDGAWVHEPRIYRDDRGSFLESFRGDEVAADLGYRMDVEQVNCSVSRRGVIRGIHFADVPPGQAKYVSCVRGAIIDVIVDIRVGSPGFGTWEAVRLDEGNRRSVFIAEGLGHAFMALTDESTVVYLCSTSYAPGREHGVNPLDPAIGIEWPSEVEAVLSEKDAAAPSLDEALRNGLLPQYADCVAYTASLRGRVS